MRARKRSWLRSRLDSIASVTRRIVADPRELAALARERAVALWSSRGGGFFGLGYVIAFIVLEIEMLVDDVTGAEGVTALLGQQLFEMMFRFASESFFNAIMAFLWPLRVLDRVGPFLGGTLLLVGWWGYARLVAPRISGLFEKSSGESK